jgi:hypothetical protein
MKAQYNSTSMIAINVGDKVFDKQRKQIGIVKNIKLVPNGNIDTDKSLIALLSVAFDNGKVVSTANNFEPIEDYDYEECYPSNLLSS